MAITDDIQIGGAADVPATTPSDEPAGEPTPKVPERAADEPAKEDGQPVAPKEDKYRPDLDDSAVRKSYEEATKKITQQGQELARAKAMLRGQGVRGGQTASPAAQPAAGPQAPTGEKVNWADLAIENPEEYNRLMDERLGGQSAPAQPVVPAPTADPNDALRRQVGSLELSQIRNDLLLRDEEYRGLEPKVMALLNMPGNEWMWTTPDPFVTGKNFVKADGSGVDAGVAAAESEHKGAEEEKARREAEERAATLGGGSGGTREGDDASLAHKIVTARGGGSILRDIQPMQ